MDDGDLTCDLCGQHFPFEDLSVDGKADHKCVTTDHVMEPSFILLRCSWCASNTQFFTHGGES